MKKTETQIGTQSRTRLIVISVLGLIIAGSGAFVVLHLPNQVSENPPQGGKTKVVTDASSVFTVPQVGMPRYLTSIADPTFKTTITRIGNNTGQSTDPVSGVWGSDARHVYSKQQPWNADGSLITIENRNGGSPNYLLLDGNTYAPKKSLCSSLYDYRWSPLDPKIMINVNRSGNELSWYDVTNCSQLRTWSLPLTANYGIGSGEGNPSADGRYVAVGNQTKVVVVDMNAWPTKRMGSVYTIPDCGITKTDPNDATKTIPDCAIDWISISPSGSFLVVQYDGNSSQGYGQTRVFDVNTTTLNITGPHTMATGSPRCPGQGTDGWILSWNHMDMGRDSFNGNADMAVGGPECGSNAGHPVKVLLSTGAVTVLTSEDNEASLFHASLRNINRPGWAYISFWKEEGRRFSDEIIAVKLDGSRSVERLAHAHSDPNDCYRCEPHPVPSPDGMRIIFASNWAQDCGNSFCGAPSEIKDYVIDTRQLSR